MIIDKFLQVSSAQAVTASAASTDVIDFVQASPDIGMDCLSMMVITTRSAVTAAGAATVTFSVQDSADNSTFTDVAVTAAIGKATLVAGYQIVIPAHRVEVDGVDVVAYYAHDVASGEMIAVTEDGLHGATVSYDRALQSLARDLAEALDKPQPFIHVHALRGAIIAWWMYGKERVGGSEHEEAIQRMLDEMDDWEKRSNLLTGLETIPQARSAMGDLMKKAGWDIDNAGASAAFKIGYIGATRFLHQELGK